MVLGLIQHLLNMQPVLQVKQKTLPPQTLIPVSELLFHLVYFGKPF